MIHQRPASDAGIATPGAVAASVIVPHYSDLEGLDRCLAALGRQTYAGGFEIVVADNMSPEGEAALLATIAGRARLVRVAERGAGPARNGGAAAATAPLLAFVDSDCVPEPAWLAEGLAALADHPIVGGEMVVLVDAQARRSGAEAFEQVFAFHNRAYVEREGFTVTANLFCSRATFDAVGPFVTGVSEDVEWCHRARARGFALGYAARAVVGHPARRDWPALLTKWRRINAERYGLVAGSRRGRLGWLVRAWLLPASIVAHAPRVLRSRALRSGAERRAALATLVRLRLWRTADASRLFFGGR